MQRERADVIAERYTLGREIGRGGMGAVWLAQDEVLGRPVAVKRIGLAPGVSDPDADRVAREARLSAMINHPHVVAVFDLVSEGDEHWLVMEYVDGISLSGLIRRDGPLDADQAAPILRHAAEALEAAHEAGIVHRDVKPSNILLTVDGDAKLTDFGIARAETDPALTQTGLVTGSPAYLSPEVASGQTATAQSDVWSLGATAFHMLCGSPPYEIGDNILGAMYRIVHEEPPRLDDAGWLAPLLDGTMTRDPAARWTMAQVRAFLASRGESPPRVRPGSATHPLPAARPQPPRGTATTVIAPSARRTGTSRPSRSTARRPSAATVLASVLALLLVLVLGWVWWDTRPAEEGPPADTPIAASEEVAEQPEEPQEPTAEAIVAFVENYIATAVDDPPQAFEMLTPGFQDASDGYEGYHGFWGTVRSANLSDVEADPEELTVTYRVDYVIRGSRNFSHQVRLRLEYADGDYLIAGEA